MGRSILPEDKKHELLQVYLHLGIEASRTLCREYGVSENYAAKRASEMDISHRKVFFGANARTTSRVNHADHRWKWAVERGAISR